MPNKYIVLPEQSYYIKNNSQDKYRMAKYTDGIDLSYEEKDLFIRNMFEFFTILFIYCFVIIFFELTYMLMKSINTSFCSLFYKNILGYTDVDTLNSNSGCLGNIIVTPTSLNIQTHK